MDSEFFNNIPKITQFNDVIEEQNFSPAPIDWLIVIADISSSTEAVVKGKYKDVNMIGGAVICAVQNATGIRDWPFVFGGDGATVLIEPSARSSVEAALVRTRTLAKDEFNLDLRIGFVPVKDVCDRGAAVLVARYEVSPEHCLAQFGGGGVEMAEKMVKSEKTSEMYAVPNYSLQGLPDLSGLSCRWEALQSQKGMILCLLLKPRGIDFQHKQLTISDFLSKLAGIIGSEFDQASPVTTNSLRFSWPPKGLAAEAKATRADRSYTRKKIELYIKSFIQWVLDRFDLTAGDYNAPIYRQELKNNSDFCKFDDVLRMVLDCSVEQAAQIRIILERMHAADEIDYGVFETERALMTCLLFDLKSSQHIHFIDGDNGGFHSASIELKEQLASQK